MIGQSFPMTALVGDEAMTIYVTQTSKTVWRATGTFRGESHSEKGSSANSATTRWERWANRRKNRPENIWEL